jgi:hypothetical protein
MDVVLPVVVGVGVALATTAVFLALRSQERWRDAHLAWPEMFQERRAGERPSTTSPVLKPRRLPARAKNPSLQTTLDVPRRSRRATSAGKQPTSRGGKAAAPGRSSTRTSGARTRVAALNGTEEVQAQADVVTSQADDRDVADYDPVGVVDARNIYWQTDGSTDCAACSSSRLRGARFCIRCGRRLVEA